MRINLLIVEDISHKRSKILEHIASLKCDITITEAASFTSASQSLEANVFDVVLLDMSLPTFDRVCTESGGRFRPFGGKELARKIARRQTKTNIIFITQYESFSDKGRSYSFESLKSDLAKDCGDSFRGMIHYDSSKHSWKENLSKLILDITNENNNC